MKEATTLVALAMCLAFSGCEGQIADVGNTPGPDEVPVPSTPGSPPTMECGSGVPQAEPSEMRRLSPAEYREALRSLLGDPGFDPELDETPNATFTALAVRRFETAAGEAVGRRASWSREVFPCDTSTDGGDACVDAFLDGFVTQAFRRSPTSDERVWLTGVFSDAREQLSFGDSMDVLLQIVLQSPQVLYVYEEGTGALNDGGARALSGPELATRLSLFIWGAVPDAALMDTALTGGLDTAEDVRVVAQSMFEDERARANTVTFVSNVLQLNGGHLHHSLEDASKDADLFPAWNEDLRAAMRTELEAFVEHVFFDSEGTFEELLTSERAYVNAELADVYGVAGPETGFAWVDLNPAQRAGILTRAGFLSVFSAQHVSSPIRRGVFVIEEMFCRPLGDPPPNASDIPVEGGEIEVEGGTEIRTVREEVTARTESTAECSSCHAVINPVGFAFEAFDPIGRHRTEEYGQTIDTSGSLRGTDVDGPVSDAAELSRRIAGSEDAKSCLAEHFIAQALARSPGPLDRCSQREIEARFVESGDLRELMLSIVVSDAFRYLTPTGDEL